MYVFWSQINNNTTHKFPLHEELALTSFNETGFSYCKWNPLCCIKWDFAGILTTYIALMYDHFSSREWKRVRSLLLISGHEMTEQAQVDYDDCTERYLYLWTSIVPSFTMAYRRYTTNKLIRDHNPPNPIYVTTDKIFTIYYGPKIIGIQ